MVAFLWPKKYIDRISSMNMNVRNETIFRRFWLKHTLIHSISAGWSPDIMVHIISGLSPGRTICCGGSSMRRGGANMIIDYD